MMTLFGSLGSPGKAKGSPGRQAVFIRKQSKLHVMYYRHINANHTRNVQVFIEFLTGPGPPGIAQMPEWPVRHCRLNQEEQGSVHNQIAPSNGHRPLLVSSTS